MNTMQHLGHVVPKKTLYATYFGLVFLTAIMIGLSRIDTHRIHLDWLDLHTIKAFTIMGVALVMGIIVAMYLMGLRYEEKLLNLTIFVSNFVFLLIFVVFTWADTSFRGEIDPDFARQINFESPVKAGEGHGAKTSVMPEQQGSASSSTEPGGASDSAKVAPAVPAGKPAH
jgi:caa(3)-type oxidase subunit IV